MTKLLKPVEKDHPIFLLTNTLIAELNVLLTDWLTEHTHNTRAAIANAYITMTAHFFAKNWPMPKDEFVQLAAECFEEYQNKENSN